MMEKRKHRRICLKEKDGVYGIVATALAARKTITLPLKDFSETGFRFAIVSQMVKDFFESETIFLKTIAGSRNLTFKDPVELEIRWRKYDSSRTWLVFGCEIVAISPDAKAQLLKLIEAEEKFMGIAGHGRLGGDEAKIDAANDSTRLVQISSRKVLMVSGGAPQNRSLQKVLNWVGDELRASGHHVERINLVAKTVKGCDECDHCMAPGNETGCIQKDDMQSIIDKLAASDATIYASPLCCWGFSSQLKALLDRCHRIFGMRNGAPKHGAYIRGKRQALIVTTADRFDNNAEPLLTIFNRMIGRCKAPSAGVLFVCNCSTTDVLGEDIRLQAVKFAKNLFGHTGEPYPVFIPGAEQRAWL
jgi:multimeric flavodoxin WrbA